MRVAAVAPAAGRSRRHLDRLRAPPRTSGSPGFGERSTAVDQRGRSVENYVADGPYPDRARPVIFLAGLPWAGRQRADATYYPVPWTLSVRGYGVLARERRDIELSPRQPAPGRLERRGRGAALAVRVFAGPDARRRAAALHGGDRAQPAPQAPWAYGPWFQTGQPNVVPIEDERSWIELLREADAPDFGRRDADALPALRRARDDPRLRAARAPSSSTASGSPGSSTSTRCSAATTSRSTRRRRRPARCRPSRGRRSPTPTPPTSAARGRPASRSSRWRSSTSPARRPRRVSTDRCCRAAVDDGADGWMEDFGEYTPPDAVSADGTPGTQMHNRYPTDYHCAVRGFQDAHFAEPTRARWSASPARAGPAPPPAPTTSGAATRRRCGASTASPRR